MKIFYLTIFLSFYHLVLWSQTFEISNGDTINYTDKNSLRQGLWKGKCRIIKADKIFGASDDSLILYYVDSKIHGKAIKMQFNCYLDLTGKKSCFLIDSLVYNYNYGILHGEFFNYRRFTYKTELGTIRKDFDAVETGYFLNGKKDSIWEKKYNGLLKYKEVYRDGIIQYRILRDDQGGIIEEGNYKDGQQDGLWTERISIGIKRETVTSFRKPGFRSPINCYGIGKKCEGDRCGLADTLGNIVLPFEYESISAVDSDCRNKLYTLRKKINNQYKFGACDNKGKLIVPVEFDEIVSSNEKIILVKNFSSKGSGFYNFSDSTFITLDFQHTTYFNRYFLVGKGGHINERFKTTFTEKIENILPIAPPPVLYHDKQGEWIQRFRGGRWGGFTPDYKILIYPAYTKMRAARIIKRAYEKNRLPRKNFKRLNVY